MDGGTALRAFALAALGVPAVLLAHLAVTGTVPSPLATLAVAGAALVAGLLVPARGRAAQAALVGGALVAGDAVLLLFPSGTGGCLPATVRGAELGARIGLFGEQGCPPGTFAAGTLTQAALAALVTAGALVLGHLLVAGAGAWLLHGTRRCAESCAGLVLALAGLLRRALPELPRLPVAVRPPDRPRDVQLPATRTSVPVALTHRGPPLLTRV